MPESQDIFEQYLGAPVTAQYYKELGHKIKQCSQPERERLLESFQPKELHLQLLKLTIARTSRCHRPLLDGLRDECKFVSEFSLKSRLLYCSGDTELLDANFLIPLLQTVSLSTRNRVLWNLGKYITTGGNSRVSTADIDTLYNAVAKVWGSRIAEPLLCQTSKELLERELPNETSLSNCHLLILAKRFPYVALSFLEKNWCTNFPRKAARYIVSKTIPKSFAYIVKQSNSFLSKSTMKFILKNHTNVVLEAPSSWLNVLNKHTVKKVLRPDHFELFLTKQFLEIENMNFPYELMPYFKILSPSDVSVILNKVFPEKYGCLLGSKLDFWEKNTELLKLLDASDRSLIAEGLDKKDKLSTDWLPLMTTDKSIPRIKTLLYTEQDANERATLVSKLIETAMLNKDQSAIKDICNLVITRYRNDKVVLMFFFSSHLNFSSLSSETFDLVLAAAKKFYNPNDWQTDVAANLFLIAIKRNWGIDALHEFLDLVMKNSSYLSISDLDDLETELRLPCINEVFTTDNIENEETQRIIAKFLQLITKWTAKSPSPPLINDNVKKCVLTLLRSDIDWRLAMSFVCANLNSLNVEFIEECFQIVPDSKLMTYLFSKKSHILKSEETCTRVGKHIFEYGVSGFASLLKKMRKLGHMEILQYLSIQSKAEIADIKVLNCRNAVILLMLTSDPDDFFSVIDPLLPSIANNKEAPNAGRDSNRKGRYHPLQDCKREDSIYYGIGMSISHLGLPSMAIERLYSFCVSGDLVLFVRDAVYSVSSSLPNEAAKTMLLTLMRQPVSVKKHALRLLWRAVCNIETQEVLLSQLMESEDHLSMRIILINTAITSLNVCKYVSMWQVVREMLIKLTPDDKTIVQELVYKQVPDQFMEEYLRILLEKCKTLKDVDNTRELCNVLQQVSNSVILMSQKFVESLIVEYFLSEWFFKNMPSYSPISDLVIKYLQGMPATSLPVNQVLKEGVIIEPHRDLGSRQQFLKERLDCCAVDSPQDVFDAKQGCYPVRSSLVDFIESFCNYSLLFCADANPARRYDLSKYIDFLLSYFDQFNQNAIFWPYTYLCLLKIVNAYGSESAFVLGQKVGELCDSMALKRTVALFCYLPVAVAKFFNTLVFVSSSYGTSQAIDIVRGILATVPSSPASDSSQQDVHLLRLMTVAHILPSDWVVSDDYMDFRQTFLLQIRNTPAEVFLFNAR